MSKRTDWRIDLREDQVRLLRHCLGHLIHQTSCQLKVESATDIEHLALTCTRDDLQELLDDINSMTG